jgi:AraC family transcriptional regulator
MNKEYKARIDRVIQYIETNLSNSISLTDVAEVSCFSPYHFHRIFTEIMNETVNDYIVRLRLERAVHSLICNTDLSITQIALDNSFSSSANFSKAVKLHFGFSPSNIRNPKKTKDSKIGKIYSKYGKVFNPADLYPTRITNEVTNNTYLEGMNMKVEVRELKDQRVCTLASQSGYEPEGIFGAWDKLIEWAVNNGIQENEQKRFSFAFDNPTITPADKCRYDASIVIGDDIKVNSPFVSSVIPKGKYAVLYYKGLPEEAINAQLSLYSDWLPDSGFEPDDFPMLENYLNDAELMGILR